MRLCLIEEKNQLDIVCSQSAPHFEGKKLEPNEKKSICDEKSNFRHLKIVKLTID